RLVLARDVRVPADGDNSLPRVRELLLGGLPLVEGKKRVQGTDAILPTRRFSAIELSFGNARELKAFRRPEFSKRAAIAGRCDRGFQLVEHLDLRACGFGIGDELAVGPSVEERLDERHLRAARV